MKKQVLIAGGGIAGLAAGIAAARAGWEVRLFEQAAAFSEVGAGVQLGPNVVRCLQSWGLQEPLQAVAAFPQRLHVRCAHSGATLAGMDLGKTAIARYGAAYATIHRADLHALLLQALQAHEDVHINIDQTIEGFSTSGEAVTVHTACHKTIEGDALIGADGLRSKMAAQLLGQTALRSTGHLAYRTVVAREDLPPGLRDNHVTLWLGPRLHLVHYPLRSGQWHNLVAIIEGTAPQNIDQWDHNANAADLQAVLGGTCTPLQTLVRSSSQASGSWRLWPLADRMPLRSAAQMAQGLVALIGDAAHPMRPYLAQGAGMAIEDAMELQSALSMHDLEIALRLRRYALNRWQRNARVQLQSQRNGRIFHARGPLRWGRDMALRLLGERLLDQPWLYRSPGPY